MIEIVIKSTGFVEAQSTVALWQFRGGEYYRFEPTLSAEGVVQFIPDTDTMYLADWIRGQALDLAFLDEATNRRAQAKITPFPISENGTGACKASAEVVTESGLGWVIMLSGFESGEDVTITSTFKAGVFKKETFTDNVVAPETNGFDYPMLYSKRSRGNATFTAQGSAGCSITLDFAIGKSALNAK
jgi:hypothetical protein